MKLEPRALSLVLLATVSGACASTPAITPLDGLRASSTRLHVRPEVASIGAGAAAAESAGGLPAATVSVRFYQVDPRWIDRAIGQQSALFGVTSSREQARRLCGELERLGVTPLAVPGTIEVADDARGSIAVVRQFAYVSGFEIQHVPGVSSIADPLIGTAQEGMLLEVALAHGARDVEIDWSLCRTAPEDTRMALFGRGEPVVTLQRLEGEARTLRFAARVEEGEALLFGGTALGVVRRDAGWLAVLEIERAAAGTR